jgi:Mannose-6-phosphate isomerase
MIVFAKDRQPSISHKPQGGEGLIEGLRSLSADNRPEGTSFRMAAQMTLPPGGSIGFHLHPDDEEIYVILSGQGLYTDADGQASPVGPGDLTLTRSGEGHGLANSGLEPLVFFAVIAE